MNVRFHGRRGILGLIAIMLGVQVSSAPAQTVGPGDSPGRASYRTPASWNNGPYYTVHHVDPYGPRPAVDTGQIETDPSLPPFGGVPHGRFAAATPNRGSLTPYAQGFSPYSGYANWYRQSYGVVPTRENIVRARTLFFRSAPVPPPGVLPPLPPPTTNTAVASVTANPVRTRPAARAVERPANTVAAVRPAANVVRVYRLMQP